MVYGLRRIFGGMVLTALFALLAPIPARAAAGDPFLHEQWALAKIGGPAAWTKAVGQGVRIGIVDTGADLDHPDLAGRVAASTSCLNTTGSAGQCRDTGDDQIGHGSHVAAIAAGTRDNGEGVAGVAPGAQLVVARVFQVRAGDTQPTATLEDVMAGIRWAVANGARVVNLSLGDDGPGLLDTVAGQTLGDVIEEAWNAGAIPVLAAGNDERQQVHYGNTHAIVVAATGKSDELARYSSSLQGARYGIAAPGGNPVDGSDTPNMVLSAWRSGGYAYASGTSMAAPHVSGTVAMLLSQGMTRDQAVSRVLSTARPAGCGTGCWGRLDAAAAVGAAPNAGAPPEPAPGPRPTPSVIPAPTAPPRARATVPPPTAAPTTTTTIAPPTAPLPEPVLLPPPTTAAQPRVLAQGRDASNTRSRSSDLGTAIAVTFLLGAAGGLALVTRNRPN